VPKPMVTTQTLLNMRIVALAASSIFVAFGCMGHGPATSHVSTYEAPSTDAPQDRCLGFQTLQDHVIYFVMTDRFSDGDSSNNQNTKPGDVGAYHGGDFRGLTHKLDYLADLGITAIWITPIVDQVDQPATGAGFEDWGYHGYWGDDFEKLEAHLGTEADLRELLREAHRRDIRIILDVVINHAGYRARWSGDPKWTRSPETKTCPNDEDATELTRCLMGLPDFRTENPEVRETVLGWHLGWSARFPFDGFRFDTLKHVEPEAFAALHNGAERQASELHGCEGFLVLGEWWGATAGDATSRELVEAGVADTLYDFRFHGDVEGFASGRMRAEAFAHHLEARHVAGALPMVHFLDTHDVDTMMFRLEGNRDRYALAAVLLMTVHGIPLVTWGNEVAKMGGKWPKNRDPMPWAALDTDSGRESFDTWRSLIGLRKQLPALRGTQFETLLASTNTGSGDAQLAYLRGEASDEAGAVLVVMTRGDKSKLTFEFPGGDPSSVKSERLLTRGSVGTLDTTTNDQSTAIGTIEMGSDAFGIWRIWRTKAP